MVFSVMPPSTSPSVGATAPIDTGRFSHGSWLMRRPDAADGRSKPVWRGGSGDGLAWAWEGHHHHARRCPSRHITCHADAVNQYRTEVVPLCPETVTQ